MKIIITILVFLLTSLFSFGQTKQKTKPLIIKGRIADCPEKQLFVTFRDKNEQLSTDTIQLDASGRFYLQTYKVQSPQQADIGNSTIKIRGLFVAPGYNLTLTGNGNDNQSLFKSKKISGIGSESNRYRFILDSILFERKEITWYELKEADLLSYIDKDQKLKDSLALSVFTRPSVQDKYLQHFESVIRIENKFNKLYRLLLYVYWNNYSAEHATSFIWKHFDNKILSNIYDDGFFISDYYRQVMESMWLDYLVELDFQKDSSLRNQENYNLKRVSESYKGKIKEYVLYTRMTYALEYSKSLKQVNDYIEHFEPYISSFQNDNFKKLLAETAKQKEKELAGMQVGKPAPLFTLKSNQENIYSLNDFRGKVVYLDFWASWCLPCREELPRLKALHAKYKNDDRIVFISIGVHDEIDKWKTAIEMDKPEWLQLIDKGEGIWKYYGANAIPRFILIDKQGNIAHFDAPPPSSGQILEDLLNREIVK